MFNVKIEKLVYNGYGISKLNEKVIFVDYVLPEEIVLIDIYKEKKNLIFAKPKNIIKSSHFRVKPICEKFFTCGGCSWQHIEYNSQLSFKKEILIELLKKIGKFDKIPYINILNSSHLNYRNRVRFHIKNKTPGFYEKSSNNFINIDSCPILSENINNFLKTLKIEAKKGDIEIFSTNNGDIITNFNKQGYLFEFVGNFKFQISKGSFFQTNRFLLEDLINIVIENSLNGYKRFADLYSGIGFFTIPLSKIINFGIGIESSNSSYKDSLKNLNLNNVKNVKFFKKKVEKSNGIIKSFKPDLIILDPPRKGLQKNTIELLLNLNNLKKIIYVSCNPVTLSRDLNFLKTKFNLQKLYLIDMFPHTFHIETISVLVKK